jgi:uncharacterized protein (DUF2461 family)
MHDCQAFLLKQRPERLKRWVQSKVAIKLEQCFCACVWRRQRQTRTPRLKVLIGIWGNSHHAIHSPTLKNGYQNFSLMWHRCPYGSLQKLWRSSQSNGDQCQARRFQKGSAC